jgi:hypothetical protein
VLAAAVFVLAVSWACCGCTPRGRGSNRQTGRRYVPGQPGHQLHSDACVGLARCGMQVRMGDVFGLAGARVLDRVDLPVPYRALADSLRGLIETVDFEIGLFADVLRVVPVRCHASGIFPGAGSDAGSSPVLRPSPIWVMGGGLPGAAEEGRSGWAG